MAVQLVVDLLIVVVAKTFICQFFFTLLYNALFVISFILGCLSRVISSIILVSPFINFVC